MTNAKDHFDMNTAPIRIGTVRLRVRDLDLVSSFYQTVLGLAPIHSAEGHVMLGTGTTQLLELIGDPALAARDPRRPGLFHIAFLMPSRADLALWLTHMAATGVPLQGASDHIVSEALYLADPEGNGIEVYVDRPYSHWHDVQGKIRMSTDPLDMDDLLKNAAGTIWTGFPKGGRIGHVHLQVGDIPRADRFYRDVLGLEITARYPGGSFYGSGGYHHQLAGNVWNSRHAEAVSKDAPGLDQLEIVLHDAATRDAILKRAKATGTSINFSQDAPILSDPWGTRLALVV